MQIESILEYSYRNFGLNQAIKYKTNLEYCFQLLADNPDMGRKSDELRQKYFRHKHESHIIFYRKRQSDIFIVAIIHDKMDIENIFSISDKV